MNIKETLSKLINEETPNETLEAIKSVIQEVESLETSQVELVEKYENLRKKYIESVKYATFEGEPAPNERKPRTLEEIFVDLQKAK